MPIASFLEEYDFTGKTIIPFCSHGGGRFGQSLTAISKPAADKFLMFSFVFSVLLGATVLIGNEEMLRLLFGKVEQPVMEACITYLRISAYSYPALAVYNAAAYPFPGRSAMGFVQRGM